jgi:hypothetical protein
VHFNPRVNPFKRSEDESVSRVGTSACFTQRASRTEPYLKPECYSAPLRGLAASPTGPSRGGAGMRRMSRVLPSPPPYSSHRRPSRRSGSPSEGSASTAWLVRSKSAVRAGRTPSSLHRDRVTGGLRRHPSRRPGPSHWWSAWRASAG